jgi:hypothetical protein
MRRTTQFPKLWALIVITFVLATALPVGAVTQEEIVWQPTNGPYGGTINALAGSDSGGVLTVWRKLYVEVDSIITWKEEPLC